MVTDVSTPNSARAHTYGRPISLRPSKAALASAARDARRPTTGRSIISATPADGHPGMINDFAFDRARRAVLVDG
jgi:hypothetical protein